MDAELPLELILTLGDWPADIQLGALARRIQSREDFDPESGTAPSALLVWGTSGLPALAEAAARFPDTPSIVFTEACTADLAQAALQFGADEVILQADANPDRMREGLTTACCRKTPGSFGSPPQEPTRLRLTRGMAREFSMLFNSILRQMHRMEQARLAGAPVGSDTIQEVQKNCYYGETLISQLRQTYSIERRSELQPVFLPELVQATAEHLLAKHDTEWSFEELTGPDTAAHADPAMITQLLAHLFDNALEAMTEQPRRIRLRLEETEMAADQSGLATYLEPGRYLKLTVANSGPPIPEEERLRIFDPYYTTREQASGLGLSNAYAIMVHHRGLIRVSEQDGAAFELFFTPIKPCKKEVSKMSTTQSLHILVMDDEKEICTLLARLLEREGLTVSLAHNSEQALEIFNEAARSEQPIRGVIADLQVPGGLGGQHLLASLRERGSDIPCIATSGYPDEEAACINEHGFSAFLPKPFDIQTLRTLIKESILKA